MKLKAGNIILEADHYDYPLYRKIMKWGDDDEREYEGDDIVRTTDGYKSLKELEEGGKQFIGSFKVSELKNLGYEIV